MAEPRACELEFMVRDSELDAFGVVNHANYFHYLEHARHRMFAELGLKTPDYFRGEQSLAVAEIEARFLRPLVSGDRFVVLTTMARVTRVKMVFRQRILRMGIQLFEAQIVAAAVSAQGRPLPLPDGLREKLIPYLEEQQA